MAVGHDYGEVRLELAHGGDEGFTARLFGLEHLHLFLLRDDLHWWRDRGAPMASLWTVRLRDHANDVDAFA